MNILASYIHEVAADFDAMAPMYDRLTTARYYDDLIVRSLPERPRLVVDLGCGTGSLTEQLATCADQVLGIDVSAKCLKLAEDRVRSPNVQFFLSPLEDLAEFVPESQCDAIVANRVLHHCLDLPSVIVTLLAGLRPGGVLLILDLYATGAHWKGPRAALRTALYRCSVCIKALCSGRLRVAVRDLLTERALYKSPPWRTHFSHEPDYCWTHIADALLHAGAQYESKLVNFRFVFIRSAKGMGVPASARSPENSTERR